MFHSFETKQQVGRLTESQKEIIAIMSCSSDPPNHVFAEHTNSGKIFCRKCALFLGDLKEIGPMGTVATASSDGGADHASATEASSGDESNKRPTCPAEEHNYYQHTKSMRLYCTKCGKFEGAPADIQSAALAGVTKAAQKGADSAKKGIQSIKGKFKKSTSVDDVADTN